MNTPRAFLTLNAALVFAASLSATVIYQDDFTLPNGTNPVQPNTAINWYGYNSGNTVSITNNALLGNPGVNASRGVIGVFAAPVVLGVGDSLRFDFSVTFNNGPTTGGSATGLRFGFGNSNGTTGSATGAAEFNNDQSYFARVTYTGATSPVAASTDLVKESGASPSILGGTDGVVFTSALGTATAVTGTTPKLFGMLITRINATSVTVSLFEDGNSTSFYTGTDSSGAYFSFDEVAVGTGPITSELSIDQVVITSTLAIPEPGAAAFLAGLGALALVTLRRRRLPQSAARI